MASPYIGTPTVKYSGTWAVDGNDRLRDVDPNVTVYDEESTPFMSYLSMTKGRTRPTRQTEFEWYENQYDQGVFQIDAGFDGGSATETVTINNPAVIRGAGYVEDKSEQMFIVTAVSNRTSSACDITVALLPAGTIQAVAGPVKLSSIGNLLIENGAFLDAVGTTPVRLTNTISKTDASIAVTAEEAISPNYWGSKWERDREFSIQQFRKDMERNLLRSKYSITLDFAQTSDNGSRTGTLRTTRGLLNTIQTNRVGYLGTLNEATLDKYLRTGVWPTKYSGSSIKLSFWGPDAMNAINSDLKQKIRILELGRQNYGFDLAMYTTFGNRRILIALEQEFYDIPSLQAGIVTVDPKNVYLRQYGANLMEVIDTSLQYVHGKSASMVAMYGMEARWEMSHSMLLQTTV